MESVIVELERRIFKFETGHDTNLIFLVKELVNDEEKWSVVSKGWEYSLWYEIGERGGLAEAEELLLMIDGEKRIVSIEDYVSIYRNEIKNAMPIAKMFEEFTIEVNAKHEVNIREYIVDKFEKTYSLEKVNSDEKYVYYNKEVLTPEELLDISIVMNDSEYSVSVKLTRNSK